MSPTCRLLVSWPRAKSEPEEGWLFLCSAKAYPVLEGTAVKAAERFYRRDRRFAYEASSTDDESLLREVRRYLVYVEKAIIRERAFVANSFHAATMKPLLNTVRGELLSDLALLMRPRVLLLLLEAEAERELRVLGAAVREASAADRQTFRENLLTAVKVQGLQLLTDVLKLHKPLGLHPTLLQNYGAQSETQSAPSRPVQRMARPPLKETQLVEALLRMRAFHEKTVKDEFPGDAQVLLGLKVRATLQSRQTWLRGSTGAGLREGSSFSASGEVGCASG